MAAQAARIYLAPFADAPLRGFSVVTRDSLVYTLRTLGLKYDTKVFERIMNKTMFKALRMQRDELGLTPDYRVRGFSALVEKRSPVPG
jgi:hypothetical protein